MILNLVQHIIIIPGYRIDYSKLKAIKDTRRSKECLRLSPYDFQMIGFKNGKPVRWGSVEYTPKNKRFPYGFSFVKEERVVEFVDMLWTS
jgi:hypothetical protein